MKRIVHIRRFFSTLLLLVFSIAITPWSIFHAHEAPVVSSTETHCLHKQHISVELETCLVCKAHFEKNFTLSEPAFIALQRVSVTIKAQIDAQGINVLPIAAKLRGPPTHT